MVERLLHKMPPPEVLEEIREHIKGARLLRRYTFVVDEDDGSHRIFQILFFLRGRSEVRAVLQEVVDGEAETACSTLSIDEISRRLSETIADIEAYVFEENGKGWRMYVDIFGRSGTVLPDGGYYN